MCHSCTANVENVVKAPRKPTPRSGRLIILERPASRSLGRRYPNAYAPTMLTPKVAQSVPETSEAMAALAPAPKPPPMNTAS